jgi:cytochrome c556
MKTLPRPDSAHRIPASARRSTPALLLAALVALAPGPAASELRALVPPMLDNLSSIDRIGSAVALEQYGEVARVANDLMARASSMQDIDLEEVGIDPARDAQWDAFLAAQRQGAQAVLAAAEKEDPKEIQQATHQLVGNACLGCHASFRDPARMLRPSVHVMTQFFAAWRDVNRGLAVNDFNLIETRSRELATLTGVISSDEMLESAFGIGGSKQRRIFRGFLREVTTGAERIQEAARQERLVDVLGASEHMWTEGCIACHEKFRR